MLYEHQIHGANWLASRFRGRGYLADTPGLGKTRTALTGLWGAGATHPLIVAPAIVRTHWAREVHALDLGAYDGAIIKSPDEIVRGGFPLMRDLIRGHKIDSLVIDEAHYYKHEESKRTQFLLGPDGYARRLPTVFALSGTPVPKNPMEFWPALSSLFPDVALDHGLRTASDFKERFATVGGSMVRGAWREKIYASVRNPEEFEAILNEVMLRRTLDDVGLDVPALDWQTTRLDAVDDERFRDSQAEWRVQEILERGTALEEIAADPHVARMRRRLGELKAPVVAAMLATELEESDEKVVVFAHHKVALAELQRRLAKFGVCYIDGDTGVSRRDREIDRFQNDPKYRVFLGQNIACQTGITLTAARRVVLVEPDWTRDVNVQLGKRIARIGQRAERCVAQMIALAGTLDEAIVGQNLREAQMAETIGLGET